MNEQPTAIIADDVEEMRQLLARTLESLGVVIIETFENGTDAMKQLEELAPDLCFLDIDMPGLTGLEILDAIKEKSIDTYPVIISGHSTADNLKAALSKGAKGFVVKPYTFEKIKQTVDKFNKTSFKVAK